MASGSEKSRNFNRKSTALEVVDGLDFSGKTFAITGANTGIGYETARALVHVKAHVVMFCRNKERAESAKQKLVEQEPGASVDIVEFDGSSLQSAELAVQEYLAAGWPLHCLVLNAGVYNPPQQITPDGFETTFQVNHLSQFYLTTLLTDRLLASAPSRLVVVSTIGHNGARLRTEHLTRDMLSPPVSVKYPDYKSYSYSKLCNVLFANEFNKRYASKGVTANSLHPGVVRTEIARNNGFINWLFNNLTFVSISAEQGAATQTYVATAPELEGKGGLYFDAVKEKGCSSYGLVPESMERCWTLSEELIAKWKEEKK